MKNLKNNKGFSLVELIIVIAIMAVLVGILAPQYLRYVEKSRLSADNDYIDSVRKACESIAADPSIDLAAEKYTITISNATGSGASVSVASSNANSNTTLYSELSKIVTTTGTVLKSKTYAGASSSGSSPQIILDLSSGNTTIAVGNYYTAPDASPTPVPSSTGGSGSTTAP